MILHKVRTLDIIHSDFHQYPLPKPSSYSQTVFDESVYKQFNSSIECRVNGFIYDTFMTELIYQFLQLLSYGIRFDFTHKDILFDGVPNYHKLALQYKETGVLPIYRTPEYQRNRSWFLGAVVPIDLTGYMLQGKILFSDMHEDEEPTLTYNCIFHAVYDVLGHMASGGDFGYEGELAAYLSHAKLFSPIARAALFTETVAHNVAYEITRSYQAQREVILNQEFYGLYKSFIDEHKQAQIKFFY